jgi:DNA polymerase III delta prime subunit
MLEYPPPHYLLFEPLNDTNTIAMCEKYKTKYLENIEFHGIDAAIYNSVETFIPIFSNWISSVASRKQYKFRVLIVMHSEFLSFACQQIIRRSLENKSFRNRVWFHVEDPTVIQPAIISRCIVKRIPSSYTNKAIIQQI